MDPSGSTLDLEGNSILAASTQTLANQLLPLINNGRRSKKKSKKKRVETESETESDVEDSETDFEVLGSPKHSR